MRSSLKSEEHVHVANRQLHFCNDECLILSHCIFFTLQSVPSAAVFCCEREKRLKVCTFISKNLVQDYRKDHAKEK